VTVPRAAASLPRSGRREIVDGLTQRGESTCSIGEALGVSDWTVRNHQGARDLAPVAIKGRFGSAPSADGT